MKRLLWSPLLAAMLAVPAVAQHDISDIVKPPHEVGYSRKAYEVGRHDAERDLREGRLTVEMSGGPPTPWDGDWTKLLRERFQIELRWVAGCVVTYEVAGHERGYNEVSRAAIQRRFGRDVVSEMQEEARQQWQAIHKQ